MVQIFLQFKNFQTRLGFVFFGLILWKSIYDRNKSMQTGLTIFQTKKFRLQNVDHINKTNKWLVKQENS